MLGNFMGNYGGQDYWGPMGMGFGGGLIFGPIMLVLLVWTVYWKYHALWYAAKHDHKWWFLALLVVNTVGILEILYLYVFSKKMDQLPSMSGHDENKTPMVPPQQ